ncbi:MAG TPA: polyketide synthase, partial [Steroidobacteraceae bacterium]
MGAAEACARDVAIVGMAVRVPGARTLDAYWDLLRAGREAIRFMDRAELLAAGEDLHRLSDPRYVPARGVLEGVELFDAEFFGMSPREAQLTDPQQRHFLECAWEALEDAGYDPRGLTVPVGVFAGCGWNSYLLFNLASQPGLLSSEAAHQTLLGNEKDSLTTRLSYKLNLQGPSIAIQTGCSSSLVAISMACESLLSLQSDLAVAGGV